MDLDRFDDITKALADGASRRSVIRRLAGGVLGSVAALSVVGADAKKKKQVFPGRWRLFEQEVL